MIGRLRGQLLVKRPPHLLVEVNGVGYELEAPMSTFYDLPALGETVTLVTHLAVREDAHVLYGFAREGDRDLFRALLKVTGVGAKMGLAVLSGMDAARFVQCVEQEDVHALTRLPGIGTKTAQRVVMEVKDRVASLGAAAWGHGAAASPASGAPAGVDGALAEAVDALIALGYKAPEANRMARSVDDGAKTTEDIIRSALRAAASG